MVVVAMMARHWSQQWQSAKPVRLAPLPLTLNSSPQATVASPYLRPNARLSKSFHVYSCQTIKSSVDVRQVYLIFFSPHLWKFKFVSKVLLSQHTCPVNRNSHVNINLVSENPWQSNLSVQLWFVAYDQACRSLYAEYAECVGFQVPEGAPKIKVCKKKK